MLLRTVWRKLGTVSGVWTVSEQIKEQYSRARSLTIGSKWRPWTATLVLIALLVIFAGIETGLIFAIRTAYSKGVDWLVLLVGIIAFVTLISGYLPIPFELLKRRGRVVGIDFVFLTIDFFGAFFSLLALVAQNEFDVLFGTMYALW